MFDRFKYKDFARQQLKSRILIPSLIILSIVVINFLITLPLPKSLLSFIEQFMTTAAEGRVMLLSQLSTADKISLLVFYVVIIIIRCITEYTQNVYFIKMTRTPEPVSFKEFLIAFKKTPRALLTGLWMYLWIFIWAFLLTLGLLVISFALTVLINLTGGPKGFVSIIPLLLLFGVLIPMIYKFLQYSFTFFFAAEYQNMSVRRCLQLSIIITKGHIKDLLILYLSFILWFIASVFTRGIVDMIFKPYLKLTLINTYHALIMEACEAGTINAEEVTVKTQTLTVSEGDSE